MAGNDRGCAVSISTSRCDALLMAGKLKDQTFWWDCQIGSFSGYARFDKTVPAWVRKFNDRHYSEKYLGKAWQPSGHANAIGSPIGKIFGQKVNNGSHTANEDFYTQFCATPWANQMLIDFAKEAITQGSLGQHDAADILNISFPSFELASKDYGPDSEECYDLVGRFDQSLYDLLQFLDNKIGLGNCLIVFTAGHGALPETGGEIDAKSFCNQLNTALSGKLGKSNWIEAFTPPNLYLNLNAIDHSNYRQPDVEKLAAKLGRSIPGVAEIYTAFQFFMNEVPIGPQVDMVKRSYYWGRSGELYVIPKPACVFTVEGSGIECGSPYNYDTQVPLILFGYDIRPGTYATAINPADIAPTVSNILGINSPELAEGRVLNEAISGAGKVRYAKPGK